MHFRTYWAGRRKGCTWSGPMRLAGIVSSALEAIRAVRLRQGCCKGGRGRRGCLHDIVYSFTCDAGAGCMFFDG